MRRSSWVPGSHARSLPWWLTERPHPGTLGCMAKRRVPQEKRCQAKKLTPPHRQCIKARKEGYRKCGIHLRVGEWEPEPDDVFPRTSNRPGRRRRLSKAEKAAKESAEDMKRLWKRREKQKERLRKKKARDKKIVEEAATFCGELLMDGSWQKTVASRATGYVSDPTWKGLFGGRRTTRCKILAKLAADILTGKQWVHNALGSIGGWVMSLLGSSKFEQSLVRELIKRLPLPWDAKLIATARGIQITGILLCLADGRDLTRCECFIALALEETKTRVKKILAAALSDWVHLAEFPPKETAKVA